MECHAAVTWGWCDGPRCAQGNTKDVNRCVVVAGHRRSGPLWSLTRQLLVVTYLEQRGLSGGWLQSRQPAPFHS